jgi:peptidyl-prolyl cis-trans isomerase C
VLLARALELGIDKAPEIRRRYENLLIAELKERELKPKLEQAAVGPEEVRNAVHQAQRRQPAQVRIAVLQLTANSRASENKRTQLAERLIEAREKALRMPTPEPGFGALAVDYSDDQTTRYTGGDKGWFDVGNTNYSIAPEILAAANSLPKVGDVSEVIRTDRGLYLVRLMDRRAAGPTSLTAQEPAVQQKLLAKERKRIEAEFGASIRSNLRVEVNTPAFAAVQYQTSTSMAQNAAAPQALP